MQSMSMQNPREVYRRQSVMTASPVELIIMLYEALHRNVALARRAISRADSAAAHEKLMRSQEIVAELINCLDLNFSIAGELLSIYEFLLRSLEEANVKKDAALLTGILEITDSLLEAWREISVSVAARENASETLGGVPVAREGASVAREAAL